MQVIGRREGVESHYSRAYPKISRVDVQRVDAGRLCTGVRRRPDIRTTVLMGRL